MTDKPAERFAELPPETQQFLTDLSKDDIDALKTGLPIFKRVLGAGHVLKWVGFTLLSILAGVVLMGESIMKILSWMKGH